MNDLSAGVVSSIDGIPSFQVEAIWPSIEALIGRALAECGGWYTPESVKCAALLGDMQIWVISRGKWVLGVGVTEIRNYPSGARVAWIFALAGESFDLWAHHLETVRSWAKAQGCKSVAVNGRKGWARKLNGWRELSVVLESDL